MKVYTPEAVAALEAGDVMTVGAVKIATADPFLVWGGDGPQDLDGETHLGIGSAGLITVTGQQLGGTEDGIVLNLSGVDATIIPLIEEGDARGARATIRRLLFDGSGHILLDDTVFERGAVDKISTEETPAGKATITCNVETAARGLGRATGRMWSDADQRMVDASDGGFKWVTQAPELTLAWGGKPPARAGSALPTSGAAAVHAYFDMVHLS